MEQVCQIMNSKMKSDYSILNDLTPFFRPLSEQPTS